MPVLLAIDVRANDSTIDSSVSSNQQQDVIAILIVLCCAAMGIGWRCFTVTVLILTNQANCRELSSSLGLIARELGRSSQATTGLEVAAHQLFLLRHDGSSVCAIVRHA